EIFYSIRQNPSIEVEYSFYKNIPEDSFLVIGSDIFYEQHRPDASCYSPDQMKHLYNVFQQEIASHVSRSVPLMERINLNHLDQLLKESLMHKGITIDYDYGLLSNRRQKFVFAKTSEDQLDRKGKVTEAGLHRLLTSMFRVNLFPYDSPGQLMLYFPGKSGFLWQSVWMMLLGSVLFTGIILFCFIYTVQVIFRQKKLSEIKTDFINNMTHEFKTPIATISLAADSINSPIISGNPEKVKRFATIIKEENKRMNSQVEKVLQISLLDKDDFKLKLREINLHEVATKAARNLTLQVEQRNGSIELDLDAENHMIEGDLTHVQNVIHNLLDNANKYSPENPKIIIRTRNKGNGIQVSVIDHGMGMNKEARKRIFDKFYRVHTGNLHDVKGFGLGLSYVKAIMTAHKGHIDVKSEEGQGSEFILFFPFHVET
ncbi:MAG: HAMP domain-containing sensor histidine kinase, partial [Bacteroidota bacterium]